VVHVHDASRAVGVVGRLMDPQAAGELDRSNRESQERLRKVHEGKRQAPLVPLEQARTQRFAPDWSGADLPRPEFSGRRVLDDVSLAELRAYIDWTFFFTAWELPGRFPKILEHPEYGDTAKELYRNANTMLDEILAHRWLRARAVYGFWPACSEGDDIVLFEDEAREAELARFPMLRQQRRKKGDAPQWCLADFVAPRESGRGDWVGAFGVTAGLGAPELAARYEAEHDDYRAIIAKALADRLAEACAEWLHARVRREWGYGRDESLRNEDLIAERYRGIRPAFGYPACPDHTEKATLFRLLEAEQIGMKLTESFAMTPAASVSGIYLAHPDARYFNVGRIGRDQVEDYAARKGRPRAEIERWLAPNLAYDPEA
jgi:5-methyltetrahydrofolate--homocysteine methyltransferase